MTFKKRRGIHLSYKEQGLINFTCLNYSTQPPAIREKIRTMCDEIGGEYSAPLFVILTRDDVSIACAAMEYAVSERTLYRLRKAFYESW